MNRLLCNILAFCILDKQKRHIFRDKHNVNKRIGILEDKVSFLKYIVDNAIDIKNFPSKLSENINQQINFELLNIFDKICRKYNLKYWLDFGTLIGAVRHNGFIPWDDDIDVGMPRDDYEKFLKIVMKLPREMNFDIYFNNKRPHFLVAKFVYKGLPGMIDIFPYDQYFEENIDSDFDEKYKKAMNIYHKKLQKVDKNMIIENHSDIVKDVLNNYLLKNNKSNEKGFLFYGLEFNHAWRNKAFSYDTFFPLQEHKFENLSLFIPNNYDKYLSCNYGKYMNFPDYTHNHNDTYEGIMNNYECNNFEEKFNNLKKISSNWK